jgi:hypothetical protein
LFTVTDCEVVTVKLLRSDRVTLPLHIMKVSLRVFVRCHDMTVNQIQNNRRLHGTSNCWHSCKIVQVHVGIVVEEMEFASISRDLIVININNTS